MIYSYAIEILCIWHLCSTCWLRIPIGFFTNVMIKFTTRNQEISDNAQYSCQLIVFFDAFSLGSQNGLLPFLINLIVIFPNFFISMKLFYNCFDILLRYRNLYRKGISRFRV